MPNKKTDFTEVVTIRLTPMMMNIVRDLAAIYGSSADVMRAGVMALWREHRDVPDVPEEPPTPAPVGDDTNPPPAAIPVTIAARGGDGG